MQIISNIQHVCLNCGESVGVAINPKYDNIRNIFIVEVVPCDCKIKDMDKCACGSADTKTTFHCNSCGDGVD